MNKVIVGVVLVLVLTVFVGGCELNSVVVRHYCDKEVSYNLWKKDSQYWLNLHVGSVGERACAVNPDMPRAINLRQYVSSGEEADKLIERHRRAYAERLTRPKVN
ncbi:MAG: hypothetical protein WCW47_00955 [Candidatus Paceibacterota bacterium]|jgi:hypothetical protein